MRAKIVCEDIERILSQPLKWQEFSGATVLVTGAAGMLGRYIVSALYRLGVDWGGPVRVVALVRDAAEARVRFLSDGISSSCLSFEGSQSRNDSKCPIVLAQSSQPESWAEVVARVSPEFIIHAASPASPRAYLADPLGAFSANCVGLTALLRPYITASIRQLRGFLYVSSAEVYGEVSAPTQGVVETENCATLDLTNPRAIYSESKRMGEVLCHTYRRTAGVPTTIVRPFHTYGPGISLSDGRVFADFVRDIVERDQIVIQSTGTARRAYCYIADAIEAFFRVLLAPNQDGLPYNVGNPSQQYSVLELAEQIQAACLPRKISIIRATTSSAAHPAAVPCIVPNIDRLVRLGWSPTVDVGTGFLRTIQSLESPSRESPSIDR